MVPSQPRRVRIIRHVASLATGGLAFSLSRSSDSYSRRVGRGHRAAWRRRAAERRYERDIRRWYTSQALPLYGLPPDWQGQRRADGVGLTWQGRRPWSSLPGRGRIDRMALLHLSKDGESVTVSSYRADAAARFIETAAIHDLARRISPPGAHGTIRTQSARLAGDRDRKPAWQQVVIPVDGHPVTFRLLRSGSEWVAVAQIRETYIKIDGSHLPAANVTLVRITDPRPYLHTLTDSLPR